MRRLLFVVLSVVSSLGVLAPGRVAAEPAAPAPEETRIDVTSDLPAEGAVEKARRVARRALELATARLPYRLPTSRRIVLILHRDETSFVDGMRIHNEPVTEGLSKTDPASMESRVLVAPRTESVYLGLVDDLPELARYHIAYETVVQLLRKADAPSFDQWPGWYVHGLCDSIAMDAITPKDGERPVLVDEALGNVREAAATGRLLPLARLLHADELGSTYLRRLESQWSALHRVLAQDAAAYAKLHEAVRALPVRPRPLEGERDHRRYLAALSFERIVTDTHGPLPALDAKLAAYAESLRPARFDLLRWSQRAGDETVCAAPEGSTAMLIEGTPAPGAPFAWSGEVRLEELGRRQGEVYLAYGQREDPRFLKFAFAVETADTAIATLLAYGDGAWQARLRLSVKLEPDVLVPGRWIPWRVVVLGDTLRFDLAGKTILDVPAPPSFDVLHGRVGVGAFESVARFRGLALGPPPPPPPPASPDAPKSPDAPTGR